VLSKDNMDEKFTHVPIPDNHLCEVTNDCKYTFTKLQKKIKIERKVKPMYRHILHEEIAESIDAVDQATDFGGKFISDNEVVLGGFESALEELQQLTDLII